jgi:UDPglucose 6-dehydrogenase
LIDQHLLKLYDDQYDAVDGADVLCLVTEWKQYWSPDYQKLVKKMRHPNLIDGRNIYNPLYVENQGFNYIGIGR